MNIENVQILNWEPPGDKWWKNVESKPDEPLIEAVMVLKLSHREYHELIDKSKHCNGLGN